MNKLLILVTLVTSLQAQAAPAKNGMERRCGQFNTIEPQKARASFTGISAVHNNGKTILEWKVQGNESGNHFELQTSADGVLFRTQAMVFFSEVSGQETYRFKCNNRSQAYRIKIIHKDGTESFSRAFTIEQ